MGFLFLYCIVKVSRLMNGYALLRRNHHFVYQGWAWGSFFKKDQALARTRKKLPREAGGEIHRIYATATEMAGFRGGPPPALVFCFASHGATTLSFLKRDPHAHPLVSWLDLGVRNLRS